MLMVLMTLCLLAARSQWWPIRWSSWNISRWERPGCSSCSRKILKVFLKSRPVNFPLAAAGNKCMTHHNTINTIPWGLRFWAARVRLLGPDGARTCIGISFNSLCFIARWRQMSHRVKKVRPSLCPALRTKAICYTAALHRGSMNQT
jgi:hypothetical protein